MHASIIQSSISVGEKPRVGAQLEKVAYDFGRQFIWRKFEEKKNCMNESLNESWSHI